MILLSVSTALAAGSSTSSNPSEWQAVSTPAPVLTALNPAQPTAAAQPLQLRPVQMARVPIYTLSNATLIPAGTQTIGFQRSGNRAGGMNRSVQWAIAGAAIGAIIGVIGNDPLDKALIGGAVGFGLSYVVRR